MTKAPERIWAWPDGPGRGWYSGGCSYEPTMAHDDETEYLRTDLSNALIAAAYEAAADHCRNMAKDGVYGDTMTSEEAAACLECEDEIRALTPADARAALERVSRPRWYRMDDAENPPPKDGSVFLAFDGKGERKVTECWWEGGTCPHWAFHIDDLEVDPDPTHWSPLLAPPEDEG